MEAAKEHEVLDLGFNYGNIANLLEYGFVDDHFKVVIAALELNKQDEF